MSSGSRGREPSVDIELDSTELRTSGEISVEAPSLRVFAGYELLGRLAVGGMAEVFVARERSEGGASRLVALKVVRSHLESDPSFGEMFLREGQVALGLRHPNICHVYRFGVEDGHYFIAMELVTGITVQDLLVRAGKARHAIPVPVAVKIAAAVAEALHSAHSAKDARGRRLRVVHQDVSPHNLMVAYDGTVKLLDFGVAHSAIEGAVPGAASGQEPSHTTIRGKFAYLAPEQCRGAEVDPRTDVFSLGICLFEMLTGRRLFKRGSTIETLNAIVGEPIPTPSSLGTELPEPLLRVIDRALQKAPADRYQTAAEMQEDLERFLADERLAVTSTRIADELRELLGDEVGKPAKLDARPEVVAWLRGDPTAAPIPLTTPAGERDRAAAARPRWVGVAIAVVVLASLVVGAVIAASIGATEEAGGAPSADVVPAPEIPAAPEEVTPEPPAETDTAIAATPPADEVAPPSEVREDDEAEDEEAAARARRHEERERRRSATRAAPGGFVEDPGF